MANRDTSVSEMSRALGIKPVTPYRYMGPQGQRRAQARWSSQPEPVRWNNRQLPNPPLTIPSRVLEEPRAQCSLLDEPSPRGRITAQSGIAESVAVPSTCASATLERVVTTPRPSTHPQPLDRNPRPCTAIRRATTRARVAWKPRASQRLRAAGADYSHPRSRNGARSTPGGANQPPAPYLAPSLNAVSLFP